ncbi:hypothetical protein [Roseitranquillus sediminis]|uniref:hypothetical protein n=1 Tax=Roseitranquillus sediminis TaxID=2809051 RepID=UPI001D0CA873|nr:hypothetical protein [Roseitranquillus sediminis]MBM9593309.1 hypothetical protein [Roseitranquillus sediminis]
MRRVLIAMLLLSACETSQPRVNAGVSVTPDGVRVHPSAGLRVGGVGVTVRP